MTEAKIEDFLGKVFIKIGKSEDEVLFFTNDCVYKMHHDQYCCECVLVEDIFGDLYDLLNTPILLAEERTSDENPEGIVKDYQESFTWTFYELATIKGSVTIRWYGESSGYYSESVDIKRISK
jgi:hypothetical protein